MFSVCLIQAKTFLVLINKLFTIYSTSTLFQRGAFVCEPAILVRRKQRGSQVWSMEKFENKIIDMRDMYEDRKSQGIPLRVDDSDESESVGVVKLLHDSDFSQSFTSAHFFPA